jgi:hypothetical protein
MYSWIADKVMQYWNSYKDNPYVWIFIIVLSLIGGFGGLYKGAKFGADLYKTYETWIKIISEINKTSRSKRAWFASIMFHGLIVVVLGLWSVVKYTKRSQEMNGQIVENQIGKNNKEDDLTVLNITESYISFDTSLPEFTKTDQGSYNGLETAFNFPVRSDFGPWKTSKEKEQGNIRGGSNRNKKSDGLEFGKPGKSGTEMVNRKEIKVGNPQFTLIWDTDADLDLHVIEPGGVDINWRYPVGRPFGGGALDVDNKDGFGPENIFWNSSSIDQDKQAVGNGPVGTYVWYVVYFGPGERTSGVTNWKVRTKCNEKVTEVKGILQFPTDKSSNYRLVFDHEG